MEMFDQDTLTQLEHKNPKERKAAIHKLAKTQDPAALHWLKRVHEHDPDPEVRELARQAGVYIRKHGTAVTWDSNLTQEWASANSKATQTASAVKSKNTSASQEDLEWAETYVRQALDRHLRGDDSFAYKFMLKALHRYPSLADDPEIRQIAARITDKPEDKAIDFLLDWEKRAEQAAKRQRWIPDDSYRGVLVHLAIYWIVNIAVLLFGFWIVASLTVYGLVAKSPNWQQTVAANSDMLLDPLAALVSVAATGIAVSALFPYALQFSIMSLISLIIIYFAIHMMSMLILHGEGTIPRLVRCLTPWMAVLYPLFIVIAVGVLLLSYAYPEATSLIGFIPVIYLFTAMFGVSSRISYAYRYDMGRGCIAMLLSYIFLSISGGVLTVFFLALTGQI